MTIRLLKIISLTGLLFFCPLIASAAPAKKVNIVAQARQLAQSNDFLGFRIWIQKAYSMKISHNEWYDVKNLITSYAGKAGYDLIPFWNSRNLGGKSDIDVNLDQVDSFMQAGKFSEAFDKAQSTLVSLKKLNNTRWDAKKQFPYVYHSMARALYGARRFEESLIVYQWIGPNYPFFRQVLFEKMWAAFKAGRVDLALGAVASQRSSYFSKYLVPEAYLIQSYLYKRLCREDDLQTVIAEMKEYEAVLQNGAVKDWVESDVNTVTLWSLSESEKKDTDNLVLISEASRIKEKSNIREALSKAYERQKISLLKDLKVASAYAHLAKVTDTKDALKPVTSLKSRDSLLKQNLEVWPADSTEEWIDELGKHVLIGESLCTQSKK